MCRWIKNVVYIQKWNTIQPKKRRNSIFPAIEKRMEDFVLTEVSQVEHGKDVMISFISEI